VIVIPGRAEGANPESRQIRLLDQLYFPNAAPFLDFFFSRDRVFRIGFACFASAPE
jgi:hypothetical protein